MKANFGCSNHRLDGSIGVDRLGTKAVDVICDMNLFPYPFRGNSFEEVLLSNILEHLPDTISAMQEIYRISRNDAMVRIIVPYYNSPWRTPGSNPCKMFHGVFIRLLYRRWGSIFIPL